MRSVQKGFVQQGVGSWERHTKGIGAKLLLQVTIYKERNDLIL